MVFLCKIIWEEESEVQVRILTLIRVAGGVYDFRHFE
jgi:hypothetical protein